MLIAWGVIALLFFLLFSVPLPGQGRPLWYSIGTYVLELGAQLAATILCLRNWRSPQIVSGRNVWLFIGLGLLCYFIGNLFFFYWEIGLGIEPDVSLGDIFFVANYVLLVVGMFLAVASRRLNLEIWQWGIVTVIAAAGIVFAWLISLPAQDAPQSLLIQPAVAQTAPATQPKPPTIKSIKPTASPTVPTASPAAPDPAAVQAAPDSASTSNAPEIVKLIDNALKPLKPVLNWFYIVSDIFLLIIATMLLLAFWGGRFAQSWRMIAAAAFSLYIADMWFKYATNPRISGIQNYQSGGLLEVFWVFSSVLFGIGAALEYDISSRSRSRTGVRRRSTTT